MRSFGKLVVATALAASPALSAPHTLDIDDRVPKFEKFYADATAQPLSADARFAVWEKEDGLAAVPPGPDGDAMARKLLDAAWDKYPPLVATLPRLTIEATATAREMFARDNALLGTAGVAIHSRVILYVGQFDNNAFTVPAMDGKPPTVLMPVETIALKITLAHELTHAIHMQLADVKNSFGAPLGETMFLEGLAMRTSQMAVPGYPDAAMPGDTAWMPQCLARKTAILKGIVPDLGKSGRDIAMKYTFGLGNTGIQREAYCAAWIVMGDMVRRGWTLPKLARVPEARMIDTIKAAMGGENVQLQ
jgi:hypothetical protein